MKPWRVVLGLDVSIGRSGCGSAAADAGQAEKMNWISNNPQDAGSLILASANTGRVDVAGPRTASVTPEAGSPPRAKSSRCQHRSSPVAGTDFSAAMTRAVETILMFSKGFVISAGPN